MNTKRSISCIAAVAVTFGGAVASPLIDVHQAVDQRVQHMAVVPAANVSSGFQAALKKASNPRVEGKTAAGPRIGPAVAAAVVARAAAPAVGRFAAKWGTRGFAAAGGAAAVSAGAEAGKDLYNAAKNLGKKVFGIWG